MQRSVAQLYAFAAGAGLLVAGVLGFLWSSDFSVGEAVTRPENRAAVLGLLDVNGWHNLVHIASGLLGLAVAGSFSRARTYAVVFGAVYVVLAIYGVAVGAPGALFGLVPVNAADNVFHAVVGVAGLVCGLAAPRDPDPTTV